MKFSDTPKGQRDKYYAGRREIVEDARKEQGIQQARLVVPFQQGRELSGKGITKPPNYRGYCDALMAHWLRFAFERGDDLSDLDFGEWRSKMRGLLKTALGEHQQQKQGATKSGMGSNTSGNVTPVGILNAIRLRNVTAAKYGVTFGGPILRCNENLRLVASTLTMRTFPAGGNIGLFFRPKDPRVQGENWHVMAFYRTKTAFYLFDPNLGVLAGDPSRDGIYEVLDLHYGLWSRGAFRLTDYHVNGARLQ